MGEMESSSNLQPHPVFEIESPNYFHVGVGNKLLLALCAILTTLYASVLLTYAVTGSSYPLENLGIFSLIDAFIGPLFFCALGAYWFRKHSKRIRSLAGLLIFFIIYIIESAMAYHNGVLIQYGIYPRSVYFVELLFFPAYIVITFTMTAFFLYNQVESTRWRTSLAPLLCGIIVVANLTPIDFINSGILLSGIVVLSLFSLLGLPRMHQKLVKSLGDTGHQLYSVILLGYICTFNLTAQIQLVEVVANDFYAYATLLDTSLHTHSMNNETVILILFTINWLGKAGLVISAGYLGLQMRKGSEIFFESCQNICSNSISYILPCAFALLVLTFVFKPWEEINVDYNDEFSLDVGSTPDIISFFVEPGEYDITLSICGSSEHGTDYQRRDEGHSLFSLQVQEGDNFTINRTRLSTTPDLQYIDSMQSEFECSELLLAPTTSWTNNHGTIDITNASIIYLHIDSGKATNVFIDTRAHDEEDITLGSYSLCLWFCLLPIFFVYFRRVRRGQTKLALLPQS
jgi:hypothetical protein